MDAILDRILWQAEHHPRSEAVVTRDRQIDYRTLWDSIEQLSVELSNRPVSCLALHLANGPDWIVADLAAARLGVPVVPVPAFFSEEQIKHLLADSGADLLLSDRAFAEKFAPGFDPEASRVITAFFCASPLNTLGEEVRCNKITYTSGSTGLPKGVCLDSTTLANTADALIEALAELNLQRHLCLLPYATLLENMAGIYVPLSSGRSLVTGSVEGFGLRSNHQFDAADFCRAVHEFQIESAILLPQMLAAIVDCADLERLASLKFVAVGGGCVAPELIERARALGLPVFEGYGLTECGSVVCLNTPANARIGSVGKPLSHATVSIDSGGEILVGGSVMKGYMGSEDASSYIATGDTGYFDDDGFLYVTGRIKNLIVSSFGRNISPEWVESRLMSQSLIRQVAVFGEAQPCLSALIDCDPAISDRQLAQEIDRANAGLPDYARVKRWLRLDKPFCTDANTLTANGKLCRHEIARQYSDFIHWLEGVA